jgi:hypothetical protein
MAGAAAFGAGGLTAAGCLTTGAATARVAVADGANAACDVVEGGGAWVVVVDENCGGVTGATAAQPLATINNPIRQNVLNMP